MTGVDTSRPPLGERAAQALVDAVVASDDRVEDHYLEVKSDLDLTTKKDQAKLAKFILGAANRMPDDAAKHFDGYGVMVIGASQGQLVGFPPIEVLDIEKAVAPFIGGEGPNWDIARVPVRGSTNEVLLLIVDPPKWGQEPFLCHKDGGDGSKQEQLRDGAIYYRARGETREAKSGELARLLRRASTQEKPDVQLDVRIYGVVSPVDRAALDAVLEEYITAKEDELRLALALAKQRPGANDVPVGFAAAKFAFAASGVASGFTKPEDRSEDEYHAEIENWAQRTRQAWPKAVDLLLGGLLPEAEIEVTNGGQTFFEDAQVKVHVAGDVRGVQSIELRSNADASDLGLPAPPRPWGPFSVDILGAGRWLPSPDALTFASPPPRSSWSNSGSIDLDFDVDELRPLDSKVSDDLDVVLITERSDVPQFDGTWKVTARGHHAVYPGVLTVQTAEPTDVVRALREILDLPTERGTHL